MEYRFLGRTGLKVSVISLGGWITHKNQVGVSEIVDIWQTAFEQGINFFDTAEEYESGKSEELIGKALKELAWKRSQYVITTKIYWGGDAPNEKGLSRKHVIEGLKASLERLQLEYVDVVYAHRPDNLTPMEETVRAFNWVIEKGWAFYWGTSEWSSEQISEAHAVAARLGLIAPVVEQPEYHMLKRDRFEKEYAPLYRKYGLGTTIFSPLAGGLLTGKYLSGVAPEGSRFTLKKYGWMSDYLKFLTTTDEGKERMSRIARLQPIAEKIGATYAQLALAWCAKNPNVSSIITGASRKEQILENVKAVQFVPLLTDDLMKEIDEILGNKPTPETDRY